MEKLKIITWNVNSIRKRIDLVKDLIKERDPDFILLQETKIINENFPEVDNYIIYPNGEKGKNGVAILSKHECEVINEISYLGRLHTVRFKDIDISCLYMYNGFSNLSPKEKKIEMYNWMHDIFSKSDRKHILSGDFNIFYKTNETTAENPYAADEIAVFRRFETLFLDTTPKTQFITWWDYRTPFEWNKGYGLDKFLLKGLTDFSSPKILRDYRAKPNTSDHAPVEIVIEI